MPGTLGEVVLVLFIRGCQTQLDAMLNAKLSKGVGGKLAAGVHVNSVDVEITVGTVRSVAGLVLL